MSKDSTMVAAPFATARLRFEFVLFFVAVPLVIAVFFPPNWMFPALFAFTGLGIVLLHATPGFQWAELRYGWANWSFRELALFTIVTGAFCVALIYLTRPDAAFVLLRHRPEMLAFIWIGYPLLSALPQELLFRPLFFRRYRAILREGRGQTC